MANKLQVPPPPPGLPAYGSVNAAPQDEFDMLASQEQQAAPDEFSALAKTDRTPPAAAAAKPAPAMTAPPPVLATEITQPTAAPAQPAPVTKPKPKPAPRMIGAPAPKAGEKHEAPHQPTPLEQVGSNIAHVAQDAYKGAHNVPVLGDILRLGEEYAHNPLQAGAATAANVPAGLIGIPQDVANLSNQLTRQQHAGQIEQNPLDLTYPARKSLDYATQVANVLMHRGQMEPIEAKEAYQQPFHPVLDASPAAAGAGDLIGNLLAAKGLHLPGPPQIKALENNPIVHGAIHGAASGEAYGALGSLATQAQSRQHDQEQGKSIRGLNLGQAVKEGTASIAPGLLLGAAGGVLAKKPAAKPTEQAPKPSGPIPADLFKQETEAAQAQGNFKPVPQAPRPQPTPGTPAAPAPQPGARPRKSFDFAPGMKDTLEAKDAADVKEASSPYSGVKKIDDWKNLVNDQLANAQSADDILQAKNDAAAWIAKNAADKNVREVLRTHLDKVSAQTDLKIKADTQRAEMEAKQAQAAAAPPPPAPIEAPPPPPEMPTPPITPEQEALSKQQKFISDNFPRHEDDISVHDFSKFVGTFEKQYQTADEVRPLQGMTPHDIYDHDLHDYLDQIDRTRAGLKSAYENADPNGRKRISGVIRKLEQHEQALVHEKARREYLKAQGVKPDWAVAEEQAQPIDTLPEPVEQTHDFKQVPDQDLLNMLLDPQTHGLTDEQHTAAVNEYEARNPEQPAAEIPARENSAEKPAETTESLPSGKEEPRYIVDKQGVWYHVKDQYGNVLSKTKDRKQAERRVESLNAGKKPGQGKRTDKNPPPDDSTSYQRAAIDYGKKFDTSNLPPEVSEPLQRMVEKRHAFDQARNKVLSIAAVAGKAKGLDLKLKSVRRFDPEAEQAVADAAKNPNENGFSIEVNPGKKPSAEGYKPAKGENVLGSLQSAITDMKVAEKSYDLARDAFKNEYLPRRGELPPSINVDHDGHTFNVRLTNAQSRQYNGSTAGEQVLSDDVKHIVKAIEKDPYLEQTVQAKNLGEVFDAVSKELSTTDGISMGVTDGTALAVTAAAKIKRGLDRAGIKLDPRMLHQVFMNQFNSDKYELHADPQFNGWYQQARGKLDLALQGVEKLHTEDERAAWLGNRYAHPDEIRAGENGADKLSPAQREGLIRQNEVLDEMGDGFEQYAEHLRQQGYNGKGFFNTILPMNNLLSTLETDLQQLDPKRYRGENWLQDLGSGVTRGIYDMYVTGNWPIHALHAIEAGTVGTAYHPSAFAKATGDLAHSYMGGDPSVKEFVESFESSSGIQKRVKEENQTKLGQYWRGLQKKAFDTAGKAIGIDDATEKLAHNDKVQAVADVIEGSIAEDAKLKLIRAMSAHIAAEEMDYPGGGTQLMGDMARALNNPSAMPYEARVEAATKIVYHMNQMIGYSPGGFSDLNVFGRMAAKTSPIFKWFTPFTTTRLQQSRVITKFFTNAMHSATAGDMVTASKRAGQGMLALGLIAMVAGRGGIPLDIQQALHAADPEKAKEILEAADRMNVIGTMLDTEVEHVTPQLFVPAFMGDSFPTQLLDAADASVNGQGWRQVRGIALLAAGLGLSSIASRMGFNQILKIAKAMENGSKGQKDVYAFRHSDTVRTGAKLGLKLTTAASTVGNLGVKAPRLDDMLGKRKVETNTARELYGAVVPGARIETAEIINKIRDDAAFGDRLRSLDPKAYDRLKNRLFKIQKQASKQEDWQDARKQLEQLDGYWERALKQHLEKHEDHNGQEINAQAAKAPEA